MTDAVTAPDLGHGRRWWVFTIVASSTIISWAIARTANTHQRRPWPRPRAVTASVISVLLSFAGSRCQATRAYGFVPLWNINVS